jgi:hypothetical protein
MNIWKPKVQPTVEDQANLPSYNFWVTKLEGVTLERQYSPLDKLDHGLPIGRLRPHYRHIWRIIVGDWYYLMHFCSPSTPAYTSSTPKFLTLLSLAISPELYQTQNPGTFFSLMNKAQCYSQIGIHYEAVCNQMHHWLLLLIKLMGLAFTVQALGLGINDLCSTLKSSFLESVLLSEVFFLVHLNCGAVCQLPVTQSSHLKFVCNCHSLSCRGNHPSVPMACKCFNALYPALLIMKKFKDSKGLSTWGLELLKTVVPKTSSELDCKRKKRWMWGIISLHCKLQHWAVQWF